ncbi:helix-turn-helix domain-containing protein [Mycobacterium sherrisii]|uniref:helix-turn-helix domain-containing protein n=1 Tax=Mycobacterium sherrisii TaxID=243061 RepID=UPI000A032074|nr:helix-turn-helix domain-containing protein [Mycobacterium sherrisii]
MCRPTISIPSPSAFAADLGTVQLSNVWARNAFVAGRTKKLIVSTDPDPLKVIVQLRGKSIVSQNHLEAALEPGDFVLYDTARPYQLTSSGQFQMQAVTSPRDALPLSAAQLERLAARPIPARQGLAALVSNYLSGLTQQLGSDGRDCAPYLADATLDLLTAVFTQLLGGTATQDPEAGKVDLMKRVYAYIEHRLSDPHLCVTEIAAAHYVSKRALQRTFENDGQTLTGWIRARRLERCRRDMANPLADQPIGAIAARWGLSNPSQFSRLFKSKYGLTAREYRATGLGGGRAGVAKRVAIGASTQPAPRR